MLIQIKEAFISEMHSKAILQAFSIFLCLEAVSDYYGQFNS